jgi:hypothetical protein
VASIIDSPTRKRATKNAPNGSMRIISNETSKPVQIALTSTPASSCPPWSPIEKSKKIEKMRMTGSGISRSERISVAIMPSKNASVTGETRLSYSTLSIAALVLL